MMEVHLCLSRDSIFHGFPGRAPGLTETLPLRINMHEDIVTAMGSLDLAAGITGNPFRAIVPVQDGTPPVQEVDTIIQIIQKVFIELKGNF
jgi:hypothetical protein